MKKAKVFAAVMVMLLLAQQTQAGVCLIMNGSFEDDGIINDIAVEAPHRWCDVNLPAGQFGGWVDSYWSTHPYGDGSSLTLCWYDNTSEANDMATVSQQVYLEDVNKIIFDIKLDTDWPDDVKWDPNKFSALLRIDGNTVWDSDDCVPDETGECRNVEVDIDINDSNLHTLSLGMRATIVEGSPLYVYYHARWDFVKFDTHCGGFGYLAEDLNYDCYVDELDLKVLAGEWLAEELNQEYDLFRDEELIINFPDFAMFASDWQTIMGGGGDFNRSGKVDFADLKMFAEHWLGQVVFLLSDLAEDDVVNFKDFAGLANRWRDNTDWINWQDDNCFELELPAADLDYDGIVNFRDYAILISDWKSDSVGHWKMNDNEPNTTVIDSSGNGNDGTFNDATGNPNTDAHSDAGKINGALSFDGTDDFVDIGNVIGTGAYTKAAWIKRADAASYNNIVSGTSGHAFWAPSSQSFKLSSGHDGSWYLVQDSENLAVDTWYHVAVTFDPAVDSGTIVLYKDGALVSGPKAVATGVAPPSPSATTYIGRYASGYYFEGSIDNVMIFNKALTTDEISYLYNNGDGTETIPGSEGPCLRSDIDGSGIVDYGDFSRLVDEWLLKSWLYGLE